VGDVERVSECTQGCVIKFSACAQAVLQDMEVAGVLLLGTAGGVGCRLGGSGQARQKQGLVSDRASFMLISKLSNGDGCMATAVCRCQLQARLHVTASVLQNCQARGARGMVLRTERQQRT
jgi:hypothetical protein